MTQSETQQFSTRPRGPNGVPPAAQQRLVAIQKHLEVIYALEAGPPVVSFVRLAARGQREQVLVAQQGDELAVEVRLPVAAIEALTFEQDLASFDALLEAIEGVSHFIHLAHRARTELPTTLLELELQAEVDKFAYFAASIHRPVRVAAETRRGELQQLHTRLYEEVRYLHPQDSDLGKRYRHANHLAARLWSRLLVQNDTTCANETLRRFYRAGQAEKISIARAS